MGVLLGAFFLLLILNHYKVCMSAESGDTVEAVDRNDEVGLPGIPLLKEEAEPNEGVHKVRVNGDKVNMGDEMGPIIVNTDGTVRRISNWHTLIPREKEATLRRITARNRERLAALRLNSDAEHEEPEQKEG